jgi:tetratricopeptide (TPR) repeat protein
MRLHSTRYLSRSTSSRSSTSSSSLLGPVAVVVALSLLVPTVPALASGGSAPAQPAPTNPVQPQTPEQIAQDHYRDGLRMRDRAWRYEDKAAQTDDEAKREKLLNRVEKQFGAAVREFQTAVGNDPRLFQAWSSLGYAQRRLGNYEDSLRAYDRSLEIQPGYTEAIEYRAEAYLGLGRLDDAKSAYMTLFSHDRERADELLKAMQKWVETHRENPGDLSSSTVDEFAQWVDQRGQIAAQTSALYPPSEDGAIARAW